MHLPSAFSPQSGDTVTTRMNAGVSPDRASGDVTGCRSGDNPHQDWPVTVSPFQGAFSAERRGVWRRGSWTWWSGSRARRSLGRPQRPPDRTGAARAYRRVVTQRFELTAPGAAATRTSRGRRPGCSTPGSPRPSRESSLCRGGCHHSHSHSSHRHIPRYGREGSGGRRSSSSLHCSSLPSFGTDFQRWGGGGCGRFGTARAAYGESLPGNPQALP